MRRDYSTYPPQIAADVESTEQHDGERESYIVGSVSVGRYIILRATEYQVFQLLRENLTPAALCDEFSRLRGATLHLATLKKFLAKLDEVGLLAGERAQGYAAADLFPGQQLYHRLKLFDPDRLFTRLLPWFRWIWTKEFAAATFLLMFATLLLSLMRWDEVASYGKYILREHFVAIFVASWLVVITHEFAHGMTCKAFGGRANEVGALLIYYFLPALYCNVSGIHLIPKRSQRLWVIAAGVYWQLLIGTFALLSWFVLAPHTLPADLAFVFFLGSVLDIVFNANPLIKLDGYYFLSQWLRMPNLMNRSRTYWRGLLRRILLGDCDQAEVRYSRRERIIYTVFGPLSFSYNLALPIIIVCYVGEYLIDSFYLSGLLLSALIALAYARRPLKQVIIGIATMMLQVAAALKRTIKVTSQRYFRKSVSTGHSEGDMDTHEQTATMTPATMHLESEKERCDDAKPPRRLRRLVPIALAGLVIGLPLMPWRASVGSYGALLALPEQETIIRSPETATLISLTVRPGQQVGPGVVVGQMGNSDLQEQTIQVQSELARVNADYDRLSGELRAQAEAAARAELQLRQRQRDYNESDFEQRQIRDRQITEQNPPEMQLIKTSTTLATLASGEQPDKLASRYPAAMAVLQSDVELCQARLEEARDQRERARKLFAEGIVPRSELGASETRASTLAIELTGAQDRLDAALIEHRRRHLRATTEMDVAHTDLGAERLKSEKLNSELRATRVIISTLEGRRELLRHKQAQFELVTPRAGIVFGEELPRTVGQYYQKGAEICRVADTSRLLLRIKVPEREIGDVLMGSTVRLKARAFPDLTFEGTVTKIGAEGENDEPNQPTYRVELTIDNSDGLLRPGMSAFARIEFGRQMIGRIFLHKIKQALRPELWML